MFNAVALVLGAVQNAPGGPSNLQAPAPDPSQIPLSSTIQDLVHGLEWVALIGCLVGLLISAGFWAAGAYSNNFQQTFNGKRGVAVSVVAAVIVGFAPTLIDKLFENGKAAK